MEKVANEGKNIRAHGSRNAGLTASAFVTFLMYFSVSPSEWGGLRTEAACYLPLYTQSLICLSSWCLAHNRQPINI